MEVGLVQVNADPTWSTAALDGDARAYALLPYSVALLQSYARRHASIGGLRFREPVYDRRPVAEAVDALVGCDVVGVSAYVWNERISLEIARRLKERSPETIVVFGGPQVPDGAEDWLRRNPFVDVACHGEGEATFTALLERAPDWSSVDGVSWIDAGGAFRHHPRLPRLTDYADLPSPYLDGTFDEIVAAHREHGWIAMWETNRGCPFTCTFCDWGSATASKVVRFDMERLSAEIEWMARNEIQVVYCADANFGILPRDVDITEAIIASKETTGFPVYFCVQSTKNATDRAYAIQHRLAKAMGTIGVTIALQSTNERTLASIKRQNISTDHYEELQRRFSRDRLYTYTDLIIGLPGETYETFADGVSRVVAGGQHNDAEFRNCYMLPNAELADPAYVAEHGLRVESQELREPHGPIERTEEIPEYLQIVVETATMPREDWVRTKVFAWLSDILYFDRLLQLPLLLLGSEAGVPLRTLVELFAGADSTVLAGIVARLEAKARSIQAGGLEWVPDPESGIIWPADQFTLVELVRGGLLDAFYEEAAELLSAFLEREGLEEHALMVEDALSLNRALFNVPGGEEDVFVVCWHTVWERYAAVIFGDDRPLKQRLTRYAVDGSTHRSATIDDWYKQLVWCDWRDKRAYLRPLRAHRAAAVPA